MNRQHPANGESQIATDETPKQAAQVSIAPRVVSGEKSAAPSKPDWQLNGPPADPLASAAAACMRLRGRDIGDEMLRAGRPLDAYGCLSPDQAIKAVEAHGYRAHMTRRKLVDIPEYVLPAVLFLSGREACVLVSNDNESAAVIWPSRSDDTLTLPASELAENYAGHVLLLQTDVVSGPNREPSEASRHWYWSVVNRFWGDYMQVIIASAMINLLALAMPLFTMNVYDRVFPNAAVVTLWSLVAGVGLALFVDAILKWVRARVVDKVARRVDLAVSAEIFRHISDLRLDSQAQPAGGLINNLKDYEQVRDFFSSQTLASLTDLLFAFLFIGVIAYIGGPLAWPPAIALGFVLVMGLMIMIPLRQASNSDRQMSGVKNAVAVEAVTDLETLKAVSGQSRMQARWERLVTESATTQERSRRLATLATTVTGFAQQLSSIGIVVIGVYLALEGNLTMGAVIAAMILSGRAMAPTAALAGLFVRASFAFSTLRGLNALMSQPSDKSVSSAAVNAPAEEGRFELKSVSLQYPGTKVPALKDVSFETIPMAKIGVIGPVGAGKTSLVRVLSGLYAPSEGMILLDGLNMAQIAPVQQRQDIQLVPQEAVLFSGTLAENIAFGVPHATNADVLRVARLAGVDRIAASHPQGFGMPIAERGRNLSGGQRQLVALARALLPKPRVLILDEPTSSMDTQTEKLFVKNLARVMRHWPMSLIVSTHRSSLLALVDTLIVLDSGEITAKGPKDAILKQLADNNARARNEQS
ncbi:type I secretion system permease/ATPase [Ruegeria sp. AU67]|uniref:type I secretion system permease/ATPase n=1 Tax=Ruegeria sp. AU67 TaxID=2108530 RepID=UPI001F2BD95A|nr:type I secretion system permease/ATPase [Ruegeria sp. AU67]